MGKPLHPLTNWHQYNKSLINRGSLTFWVDAGAMDNWFHPAGDSGTTRLSVRVDERTACVPDYSCVSKRARTMTVA